LLTRIATPQKAGDRKKLQIFDLRFFIREKNRSLIYGLRKKSRLAFRYFNKSNSFPVGMIVAQQYCEDSFADE